jgi:hypothetical protein
LAKVYFFLLFLATDVDYIACKKFFLEASMFKKKGFVAMAMTAVLFCAPLPAQEGNSDDPGRFILGGGSTFCPASDGGGHGEFAFLIYRNGWDIRNHFVIRGNSITDKNGAGYGALTLSEKISLGGISPNKLMRVYGFGEGGIGLWGSETKALITTPLVLVFGGGGGSDIFFTKSLSLYLETGYLGHWLDSEIIGGAILQIGWRAYF